MVTLRETVMIEFKLFIYCEINSYNTIDTKIAIRFLFRIAILISSIKIYFTSFYRLPAIPWPGIPAPDQWHWK